MKRLFALLLVASMTAHADPAAMSGAFSQGANFGSAKNTATKSGITSGAAQANVPHAAPTAPESSYFGLAGLGNAAAAKLAACAANTPGPTPYDDQACKAVDFSQTNAAVRPQFNLQASDPLFANARTILNDPAAIAGNITGTYSGCTTQTVQAPDTFQTLVCNSYRALEQPACTKTLNVTVTDNGLSCAYGSYLTPDPRIVFIRPFVFVGATCAEDIRFQWVWGFSECIGTNAPQFVTTIVPSEDYQILSVNLGCGGSYSLWGSCLNGNCSYAVGSIYDTFVCDQYDYNSPSCDDNGCSYPCLQGHNQTVYAALASFGWQRPVHTYSVTDAWDNQCATYEARLP